MKRETIIISLLSLVFTAIPQSAFARRIDNWSFERLFRESDLVVIVQPIKSEDTVDRTKDNPWKIEFTGVNTAFNVLHALKGKTKASQATVLHYKTDKLIENGPLHILFRTKGLSYTIKKEGRDVMKVADGGPATYLLFLKKRKDGRFEPVSGHTDSELSAKEVMAPRSGLNESLKEKIEKPTKQTSE